MEMDYNWMASSAAPQPYQYLNSYDTNELVLGNVNDAHVNSIQTLENSLDNAAFIPDSFNYNFDNSLSATGVTPHAAASQSPPATSFSLQANDSAINLDSGDKDSEPRARRSSSEEKDLTPAQSRRKAQNRAAQRAFRERKERHVRDLEAKLNLLTTTTSSLQSDNERLKLMLQRAQTENEILRAKAAAATPGARSAGFVDEHSTILSQARLSKSSLSHEPPFDTSRIANGMLSTDSSSPGRSTTSNSDSHLLSASATWDLLQSHPMYLSGAVDIGEVCERLKKMARCDGMGPMFEEDEVRKVIDEVGRSGHDELI